MIDLNKIWVYRIIPIQNLEEILKNGLHCKSANKKTPGFVTIGSKEIITERDNRVVKVYPETVVNDYVPFYFSYRTPMLFNIITGHGVPIVPQKDIIYLCCKLVNLACDDFQWCFTDGNAAKRITKFGNDLTQIEDKIDWRSIMTKDFRDANSDNDEDRVRKKHAELLVKEHVPIKYIKDIVVLNEAVKEDVVAILKKNGGNGINVHVPAKDKFYFQ